MNGFIQFVFATVLILGALGTFLLVLVCGWIVGTVYLWLDGTAQEVAKPGTGERARRLDWWNRPKRQ